MIADHTEWYHGSPMRLEVLRSGSTVTPIPAYAKAMSHKPSELRVEIRENTDTGERCVTFQHDGTEHGYLHRVLVDDPAGDLEQHPESSGAPGEEVLTTRDLQVEFLEELPACSRYDFIEGNQGASECDEG